MSKKYISVIIISIILLITAAYLFHIHRSAGNADSELKPVWKHGIRGGISEICVSVDGKVITSSSGMIPGERYSFDEGEVKVWNKNTGALIQTVYEGKDPAWAIALSKDGKTLACSIGSRIEQWRLQDGVFKKERQFSISASALAYSPDGSLLACKSGNDVLVWNAKTGKLNWHRKERNIGAYVSNGKTRRPQHIVYNIDRCRWLYFSPDGKYLAAPVVYWIGENSYRKLTLLNSKIGKVQCAVDPHTGMDAVCFSNDSSLLAIGGFGRISLLRVKDLQLVKNITWGRMVLSEKEKT